MGPGGGCFFVLGGRKEEMRIQNGIRRQFARAPQRRDGRLRVRSYCFGRKSARHGREMLLR